MNALASPVLHLDANIRCLHGGVARPIAPFQRVLVSGQPLVTLSTTYAVTNCGLAGTPSPPCSTGRWLSGATRVIAGGAPVAILAGTSVCMPTGTQMVAPGTQTRVLAG
jgi:hypothetical protein